MAAFLRPSGVSKLALLVIFGLLMPVWLAPGTALATAPTVLTAPDTIGFVGLWPSMELDASGNPVVSYSDLSGLRVLHCDDPFCQGFGESITTPTIGHMTSLELDAAGNPVISYTGGILDPGLSVMHCNDPNCSGADEIINTLDIDAEVGQTTSLALDASGYPVVSYRALGELRILHCNDPNCADGDDSITTPDTDGMTGLFSSLALDANGFPVISYYAESGGDFSLRVLHCNDLNCAGGDDSPVTLDDAAEHVTSMELDSAGNPVVAYRDELGENLKLLHCGNSDCSAGNSIETTAPGGSNISLALRADGRPVVSFLGPEGLTIMRCNDPDCSGGDESFGMPGFPGMMTSLVLDGDGVPVVSFFRPQSQNDLNVLFCGNVTCLLDFDGDGCADEKEILSNAALGGGRDLKNPWDFYDVAISGGAPGQDGVIDLPNDILGVINHHPSGALPYDAQFDRGAWTGPNSWNETEGPDGVIDLPNDILGVILQFGHSCQ